MYYELYSNMTNHILGTTYHDARDQHGRLLRRQLMLNFERTIGWNVSRWVEEKARILLLENFFLPPTCCTQASSPSKLDRG